MKPGLTLLLSKSHIAGDKGIGGIMGALVAPGVATLDQTYVTGPASELPAALEVFGALELLAKQN